MTNSPATKTPEPTLACGNCRQTMQRLVLPGHYGQTVDLDLCGSCHLIWFDAVESARLSGLGLLELIGTMAQLQAEPHQLLSTAAHCPRCKGGLKTVHNQSRYGRSLQMECTRQHGALQTFAQFLAEKGLVRTMTRIDRAALLQRDGRIACLNCGADLAGHEESCSYCGTLPSLFDVARLARALDPEGATAGHAVHRSAAAHAQRACLACGAPMQDDDNVQCRQCGATLAISRLAEAHARVQVLGAALAEHARKPAAHVVEQRLAALEGGLERQREWARQMEAEAQAARSGRSSADDNHYRLEASPRQIVFAALAALLVWWLWR